MSKYNHIHSIPIESVPKEEISQAITEWAEGDSSLEKFLWACYRNNIKTNGCHAGAEPYIGFDYYGENDEIFQKLLQTTLSFKESQIIIRADGGNPFSGPNWHLPDLSIGFFKRSHSESTPLIDSLTDVFDNRNSFNTKFDSRPLFALLHFLINKYCGLLIRIQHTEKDVYVIYFEKMFSKNQNDLLNDWYSFFTSMGLIFIPTDHPIKRWKYESSNLKDFNRKINDISNSFINLYSFQTPTHVSRDNSFNTNAHIVRDKCLKNGNFFRFNLWLKKEDIRLSFEMRRARIIRKFKNLFHFLSHKE